MPGTALQQVGAREGAWIRQAAQPHELPAPHCVLGSMPNPNAPPMPPTCEIGEHQPRHDKVGWILVEEVVRHEEVGPHQPVVEQGRGEDDLWAAWLGHVPAPQAP